MKEIPLYQQQWKRNLKKGYLVTNTEPRFELTAKPQKVEREIIHN